MIDFILIPASLLVAAYFSKMASRNKIVKLKDVFVNFSYCFIPVGIAIWGAFSLGIILPNGSYLLHILSDPFALGWNLFGSANFPWTPVATMFMPFLQVFLTLVGLVFSLDFGFKFAQQTYATVEEARRGWIPIFLYLLAFHVFFLKIFVG